MEELLLRSPGVHTHEPTVAQVRLFFPCELFAHASLFSKELESVDACLTARLLRHFCKHYVLHMPVIQV